MSTSAGEQPSSLTFRITPVALLVVIGLAVCMTPVAWAQPWLLSIYLVPVALFVWVLRVRTVVDTEQITARTMLRTTRISWDEVKSFRLNERRWLRAVVTHDTEVLLPAVRVRDLPHLAAMSGGRLTDPTPSDSEQATEVSPDDQSAEADADEEHDG